MYKRPLIEENKSILLYVDSGTLREDYARIYDSIYHQLAILKKMSVITLLGPNITETRRKRFNKLNPEEIDSICVGGKYRIADFEPFLKSLIRKEIPFSRRRIWTLLSSFKKFSTFRKYLAILNLKAILSIKFDSSYEFVAAANSLRIPTVAIQHGEENTPISRPSEKKFHEWPASILLVWSQFWLKYHNKWFQGQAEFFSINSILWHARYNESISRKEEVIVIYESYHSLDWVIDYLFKKLPISNLLIKPHPWRYDNNCSKACLDYSNKIYKANLWEITPKLGISLNSTITNELIFNNTPCISVCLENETIGINFPESGTFLNTADLDCMIELIQRLIIDGKFYSEFLKKQMEESIKYTVKTNPVERIAEFIIKLKP
jgi:hypothetical protein